MDDVIIVDFREGPSPKKSKTQSEDPDEHVDPNDLVRQLLSGAIDEAEAEDHIPDDRPIGQDELESVKATYIRTGGNVSLTARKHETRPARVLRLAVKNGWTLYGEPKTSHEKSSTSRLQNLADSLEAKMYELLGSLEIETKEHFDVTKDGLNTAYVASLAQRNTAFKDVFDRYMRVKALIEPETFGEDKHGSNTVARYARMGSNPDALGGVDGVNRQITALISGIVITQDQVRTPPEHEVADIIDATPVGEEDDGSDEDV